MKKTWWWVLGACGVLGIGCASLSAETATVSDDVAGPSGPGSGGAPRERTVHVRTTIEVEESLARILPILRSEVAAVGGYVESQATGEDWSRAEIRVPADALWELRRTLAGAGTVTSESEEVEDVTFAHLDVEARLGSAHEEEARLLALYVDRTATLADVLAVERELSRVRGDAERLDAETRALEDRIAMSRLSLELRVARPTFGAEPLAALGAAAAAGVHVAWSVALGVGVVVFSTGPTLGLVLALSFVARAGWRRFRHLA